MTEVQVVLTNGETLIVPVEEEVTDAMKSVDRRITEGEPVAARKPGFTSEHLYLIPPSLVTYIVARP